ncbi:hypothetical protein [Streptomyces chattanoogensis]|uniref:hypothetical protein n=1 Tax=Streptomyces chattanoogensis TaxID=66876 RepID=UPI0036B54BFA
MSMTRSGTANGVFWSWPAVVVSMAALLGEALVAGAGLTMYSFTEEGTGGNIFLMLIVLPVAFLLGAVPGFVVTVTLVMPALWLARWAVRWGGWEGRPAWWWTVAAAPFSAAGATVLYGTCFALLSREVGPPMAYLVLWLVLTVTAVPAALLAAYAARERGAKRAVRLVATVVGGGVAAAFAVVLLAVGAFATGLVEAYEPPRLERAALVGVWEDGHGGVLRLRPDGVATASDIGEPGARCGGTGDWEREETLTYHEPVVELSGGCTRQWYIGGTEEEPTLYYFIGDPDEGRRQVLTKQRAGG